MSLAKAFATTTATAEPTSGNLGDAAPAGTKNVSDFVTVQSLTNFAAMTGAVSAAWGGAQRLWNPLHGHWFPFTLCALFGLVSLLASRPGEKALDANGTLVPGQAAPLIRWLQPSFIALVNVFVLYGAVMGAAVAIK
ncbi:hypothetical protein [Amycolatopsis echigonensis]|uniref:Uncharacterized protein n=1 Tax=Amycolatopsis echigonensis TaxID=2576905 RepID=A0A2N3X0B4_9PSEU|nr:MULTISPECIES: hypothetical protein [Amycolatopsis]MBB2501232.1 hypothetical protein [Amycolatopsis echigonensis]PKV99549.1 hypothetical protein ATK30_0527 [Amycolatopsis niigatensis]